MGDISRNFSWHEFHCHDGTPVPDELRNNVRMLVFEVLQPLRDWLKKPVRISSGYRTPAYNAKVKGAKRSQHMKGKAADIIIDGWPSAYTDKLVLGYMIGRGAGGGVGWYERQAFTHVDIRNNKNVVLWEKS